MTTYEPIFEGQIPAFLADQELPVGMARVSKSTTTGLVRVTIDFSLAASEDVERLTSAITTNALNFDGVPIEPAEPTRFQQIMDRARERYLMEESINDGLPHASFKGTNEHYKFIYELSEPYYPSGDPDVSVDRLAIWTIPGATKVAAENDMHREILKTLGVKSHRDVLSALGYRWVVDLDHIRSFSKDHLNTCIDEFRQSEDYASMRPFERELHSR